MVDCCHHCQPVLHRISNCTPKQQERFTESSTDSDIEYTTEDVKHTEPIGYMKIIDGKSHGKSIEVSGKERRSEESHGRKNVEKRDWHLQSWGSVCDSEEEDDSLFGEDREEELIEIEFDEASDPMVAQAEWESIKQVECDRLNKRSTEELGRKEEIGRAHV